MATQSLSTQEKTQLPDLPLARLFFRTPRFAWLLLIIRLYVAYQWLQAGWQKLNSPAWMETGEALKGFWAGAVAIPANGYPMISYDWYRAFITYLLDHNAYVWFAKLVAIGEAAVGVALLLGLCVGVAAFFGAFMNWNYIMAGAASINGMLLVLEVLLILAWRVAGWYGADRFVLTQLGRPALFSRQPQPQPE
jgi:thiosulfate dehydrogenase [quinone] large subunit